MLGAHIHRAAERVPRPYSSAPCRRARVHAGPQGIRMQIRYLSPGEQLVEEVDVAGGDGGGREAAAHIFVEGVAVRRLPQSPRYALGKIFRVAIARYVSVFEMVYDVGLSAAAEAYGERAGGESFDEGAGEGLVE